MLLEGPAKATGGLLGLPKSLHLTDQNDAAVAAS